MTGYEAFCLYNAIKLHFTQESYDFFKYNGKSRVSVEAFEHRKDKYYFYKLSRRFDDPEEYKLFLVSNFIGGDSSKKWVGNLLDDTAKEEFTKRKKILQSLSYRFKEDCKILFDGNENPNEFLKTEGDYPKLLTKVLHKDINIETLIILNGILNFFPIWTKKIQDSIVWPNLKLMYLKYEPFIGYDRKKYCSMLKECIYTSIS